MQIFTEQKKNYLREYPLGTHKCGWENTRSIKVNVTSIIIYLCGLNYLAQDKDM
jgi:hypothetical protein